MIGVEDGGEVVGRVKCLLVMLLIFTNTQIMQGSSECLLLPHPSLGTAPPRSFVIEKLNINSLNVIIWTFVLLNWMFYIGFYMNSV